MKSRKIKKKNKNKNKTLKKNCLHDKFLNQLKKNFFIDAHLHIIPENNQKGIHIEKDDNDYFSYLQLVNFSLVKYKELIHSTSWNPQAIVPCTIQPTNFFMKIKETHLVSNQSKFVVGYQAPIPVQYGKLGVETFLNSINKNKNLIKVARILLANESICENVTKSLNVKKFKEGLDELGKHNIKWKWNGDITHFQLIKNLTKKCKNTKFIIDHMLLTAFSKEIIFDIWKKNMLLLSKFKNVVGVDIAGIFQIMRERKFKKTTIKRFIKETIIIFGYNKIIIGSNWPIDQHELKKFKDLKKLSLPNHLSKKVKNIYNQTFDIIYDCCKELKLSNNKICDIFRNNVIQIYELNCKIQYID